MKIEPICFNCNNFFSDQNDIRTDYGVCLNTNEFDPYLDEILELSDFSSCRDLYDKKKFEGSREGCSDFEEVELIEIDTEDVDEKNAEALILHNILKKQNVEKFIEALYNEHEKGKTITSLEAYVALGNEQAFEGLLTYFISLPAAVTIEQAHHHIRIINALQLSPETEKLINVFINELYKTPSNNTTRNIYSEIFNYFKRCPIDLIRTPLLEFMENSKCSRRIKNRILEVIEYSWEMSLD